MKKQSVKQVFFKKLDTFAAGHTYVLSGWALYDAMYDATGTKTTPATLIHYLREYAKKTKSTVKYTGKDQKYWFVPSGNKIGGAIC